MFGVSGLLVVLVVGFVSLLVVCCLLIGWPLRCTFMRFGVCILFCWLWLLCLVCDLGGLLL